MKNRPRILNRHGPACKHCTEPTQRKGRGTKRPRHVLYNIQERSIASTDLTSSPGLPLHQNPVRHQGTGPNLADEKNLWFHEREHHAVSSPARHIRPSINLPGVYHTGHAEVCTPLSWFLTFIYLPDNTVVFVRRMLVHMYFVTGTPPLVI